VAQFPNSVPSFTTKHNITDIVDESHPNSLQDEVIAIAKELGTNPRISTARATTFGTVDARLEGIESDYRPNAVPIAHGATTGLAGDDHTQYIRADGTRAFTGLGSIAGTPGTIAPDDTASAGAALTLARSDHRHAIAAAAAGASAVGDAAAEGVSTSFARADHVHSREGFGAVTAETGFGGTSTNGVATTLARSDHRHGTPALSSTTPAAETIGAAGTVGVGTTAARSDHVHPMPAFGGSVVAEQSYGQAPSVGVATTVARSDHTHGTPDISITGPVGVIVAYGGDAAPTGWLLCNGALVAQATYPALFAAIGHRWNGGVDPGGGNFRLPPLNNENRYLRGATASGPTGNGPTHAHTNTATTSATTHGHSASSGGGSNHAHNVSGGTGNDNNDHGHGIGGSVHTASAASVHGSHIHGIEFASGPTSQNHTHTVGAGTGGNVTTGGQNSDHQHQVSGATGYPAGAPDHSHGFNGWSGGRDTFHQHSMNFTSGGESSHTHAITVVNESTHTHTVNMTNANATAVPTADVVFIIKS